jgi:predicted nucleotidyltransferase
VDIDISRVREFLREKQNRRRRRLEERLEQARKDASRIIEHLGRTYAPRRIYQWGSLVEPRNFSEISDIDIGVEGLSGPEQYFAMLGDAMNMTRFPVDLLELDKLSKEMADHIRKRGRVVYERPSAG